MLKLELFLQEVVVVKQFTIKRSQIGEDNEVKFNKSTIGIATKKALESGTARIVKKDDKTWDI